MSIDGPRGGYRNRFRVLDIETPLYRCRGYLGEAPADQAPTLAVLIPGAFTAAWHLRRDGLEQRFQVLAVDPPEHGGAGPAARPFGVVAMAESLRTILGPANPNLRCLAIGISLGALVALSLAALPGSPVEAVVALDPPLTVDPGSQVARDTLDAYGAIPPPVPPVFEQIVGPVLGLDGRGSDHWGLLDAAPVPVLVLSGGGPAVFFDSTAEARMARMGANRDLVRVPEAEHALWFSHNQEVCAAILRWWDSRCAVPAG